MSEVDRRGLFEVGGAVLGATASSTITASAASAQSRGPSPRIQVERTFLEQLWTSAGAHLDGFPEPMVDRAEAQRWKQALAPCLGEVRGAPVPGPSACVPVAAPAPCRPHAAPRGGPIRWWCRGAGLRCRPAKARPPVPGP